MGYKRKQWTISIDRRYWKKEATLLNCSLTPPKPERGNAVKQRHIAYSSSTKEKKKKEFTTTEIKHWTSKRKQQQQHNNNNDILSLYIIQSE